MNTDDTRWHVLEDPEVLAEVVAGRVLALAAEALKAQGEFRIVLAGGRTPERVYARLAGAQTDWSGWHIYFGDERCLPPDHPRRNSVMAAQAWLDRAPIPPEQVHVIPAERGAAEAARAYAPVVQRARPFDLVLLGMGEDGHTASLFPGQEHDESQWVHPVYDAPKPPPERVSLGLRALNDSRAVFVLVSGKDKHEAIRRWRRGEDLPVARVHGRSGCQVFLDREAAGDAVGGVSSY